MASLVVYGSLMAQGELLSLGVQRHSTITVIVQGFRRIFAQEPSWRQGKGVDRAVLTVVRSPTASFNGILLMDVSTDIFIHLDKRERGYDRYPLAAQDIRAFKAEHIVRDETPYIYVGKPHLYNPSLRPNRIYQQKCLQAAKEWGEQFYQTFLDTTDREL